LITFVQNNTTIQNILVNTTFVSETLPLVFCSIFHKKIGTKYLKVFFVYAAFLAFFSVSSLISVNFIKSPSLYAGIIKAYVICEYCLFSLFFYNIFLGIVPKRIIIFSIIPFLIIAIYDYYLLNKTVFRSNVPIIEFLAFIIFIVYFFYERMKYVVTYPLYQTITFWISVGLFLYFTGNFFFLIFKKTSSDTHLKNQMGIIYSLVTISKNIILSSAFFANEVPENQEEEFSIPANLDLDDFSGKNIN